MGTDFARTDLDRLRLIRTESVGPITYRRLLARFGSPAAALAALPDLARAGGGMVPAIPAAATIAGEVEAMAKLKARFVFLDGPDYPPFLADLPDAPPALGVLGDIALLSTPSMGIVGARNASANGMRFAEQLAADLAPLTVISGLARGIDAAAHRGSLSTGRTIACVRRRAGPALPARTCGVARADRRRRRSRYRSAARHCPAGPPLPENVTA